MGKQANWNWANIFNAKERILKFGLNLICIANEQKTKRPNPVVYLSMSCLRLAPESTPKYQN